MSWRTRPSPFRFCSPALSCSLIAPSLIRPDGRILCLLAVQTWPLDEPNARHIDHLQLYSAPSPLQPLPTAGQVSDTKANRPDASRKDRVRLHSGIPFTMQALRLPPLKNADSTGGRALARKVRSSLPRKTGNKMKVEATTHERDARE